MTPKQLHDINIAHSFVLRDFKLFNKLRDERDKKTFDPLFENRCHKCRNVFDYEFMEYRVYSNGGDETCKRYYCFNCLATMRERK